MWWDLQSLHKMKPAVAQHHSATHMIQYVSSTIEPLIETHMHMCVDETSQNWECHSAWRTTANGPLVVYPEAAGGGV